MKDPVKILKSWILLSAFALFSSHLTFPVECHIQRQRQLILKLEDADSINHNLLQPLMLTPLIKSGRVADARRASQVTDLNLTQSAGQGQIQSQQLDIVSHSGFLSVSPDNHLFFWFFPNRDPTAPLLLWLQGGPGESSMYGLFTEHGPFKLVNNTKDDSIDLKLREKPWTQTHSIIYMDSPVGTGFSFTENPKGYAKNQDDVARDLYEALLQFFQLFPEQKSVDFYATGESYGGKYVPAITRKIHLENRILANLAVPSPSFINLKGMAIGNPLSDPISTFNYGDFLYNIGLIGKKGRKVFQIEEQKAIKLITEEKFFDAFKVIEKLLFGYKSNVTNEIIPSIFLEQTGLRTMYNYLTDEDSPDQYLFIKFLQQESVRRAIHAGNGTFSHADADGLVGENLAGDIFKSVLSWYDEILDAPENYRVMVYTGQVDILCNEPGASDFIAKLNWTRAAEFQEAEREIWWINQDDKINVAGYAQEAGGFTQVLVRNAGHRVPWDQPTYAFDMINRFTRGKSFVTAR